MNILGFFFTPKILAFVTLRRSATVSATVRRLFSAPEYIVYNRL